MQEVIVRGDGGTLRIKLEAGEVASTPENEKPKHTKDFTSLTWRGTLYTFTPLQRSVVAALWRAREDGYHFMSNAELIEVCGSTQAQVYELFRKHPAWGSLIVPGHECGGPLGTFRIVE